MYCPTCGSEERQLSQFCRVCGTDMRAVRSSLERPDEITASAALAREQIGRAIAEKIREVDGARDLERVAEDVLPQIEKFLESPEQRRLRTARSGVVTSVTGLGVAVIALLLLLVIRDREALAILLGGFGLGVLTFLIGVGLVLNGIYFTLPKKQLKESTARPLPPDLPGATNELHERPTALAIGSVTEHTTQHLGGK